MEEDIQNHSPTVMFRGTPCIYSQVKGTIRPYFKNFKKERKNPGNGKKQHKEKRRMTNLLTKGKQRKEREFGKNKEISRRRGGESVLAEV